MHTLISQDIELRTGFTTIIGLGKSLHLSVKVFAFEIVFEQHEPLSSCKYGKFQKSSKPAEAGIIG